MVQTLFRSVKICWCLPNLGLCLGEPPGFYTPFALRLWIFSQFWIRRFDLSCSDLCVYGMDTDGAFPLSGSLNFASIPEAEKLLYDHWLPLCDTAWQLETINRKTIHSRHLKSGHLGISKAAFFPFWFMIQRVYLRSTSGLSLNMTHKKTKW